MTLCELLMMDKVLRCNRAYKESLIILTSDEGKALRK
jgi:hypothetical protein